jgi:hypothetical protein
LSFIDDIIKQLEAQRTSIERALEALRGLPATDTEVKTIPISAPATRKGGMTPEGRKRLAEAMRRRWLAKRTAAQAKKQPGRPRKAA